MMRYLLGIVLLGLVSAALWATPALADPYYNSEEAGCDGTVSTVLRCESFEKRGNGTFGTAPITGAWIEVPDGHGDDTFNKGWFPLPGSISNRAVVCGAGVTPFGNCAGVDTPNGATHNPYAHFKTSGCGTNGTQFCSVSTVYFRWYSMLESGINIDQLKHMNVTNSDGDIAFVNIQFGCGGGGGNNPEISLQVIHGYLNGGGGLDKSFCNDGPVPATGGGHTNWNQTVNEWYFHELRVTVGSSAIVQYWSNRCGTTAAFNCGAAPILRVSTTGNLPGNANGSQIQTIWPEAFCASCASGKRVFWDNIKVSTTGPIGFAGTTTDTTPPTAPTGVTVSKLER